MGALDCFQVVLLDMNGTFMFGGDRFSDSEDFAATYHALGGYRLQDAEVNVVIRACYDVMLRDYKNPEKYDSFPQVIETLQKLPYTDCISQEDIFLLEHIFTLHELGTVPTEYATFLKKLAITHELGLVANIWAKKSLWIQELERVEIKQLFKTMVFSSDYSSMKPSPKLFQLALDAFTTNKSQIVFIGDSLVHDIRGAQAVGLSTIWINNYQCDCHRDLTNIDFIIDDLLSLS